MKIIQANNPATAFINARWFLEFGDGQWVAAHEREVLDRIVAKIHAANLNEERANEAKPSDLATQFALSFVCSRLQNELSVRDLATLFDEYHHARLAALFPNKG